MTNEVINQEIERYEKYRQAMLLEAEKAQIIIDGLKKVQKGGKNEKKV